MRFPLTQKQLTQSIIRTGINFVVLSLFPATLVAQTDWQRSTTPSELAPVSGLAPVTASPAPGGGGLITSSSAPSSLPREHGQVWREYNIKPYTSKTGTTVHPERAIVDWIVKDTGQEAWFGEQVSLLSANKDRLRVYHTPEIQRKVTDLVERFNASDDEPIVLQLRLLTIGSPNWRTAAHSIMTRVPVQTPGIDAWLISRENAALLSAQLTGRTDYQDFGSPSLVIVNGQSHNVSRQRPQNFVKDVQLGTQLLNGPQTQMGQVSQGYSLDISPLVSADRKVIDAVVKCEVDQIEKLQNVPIDIPVAPGTSQEVNIQVPQVVSWSVHERFRWPADKVLLLSAGVVATPGPKKLHLKGITDLPHLFDSNPGRADALLFIEYRGRASQNLLSPAASQSTAAQPATFTVPR